MLLIKNAKILTMTGADYDNGNILIDGSKIVKV
jgi:imidazolonepropionase-like amidohydrolase